MKPLEILAIGVGAYGLHRFLSGTNLEPYQLANRWITTLAQGTPDHMIQLYAQDAVLIPTFGEIKRGKAAIKGYFDRFMSYENLRGQYDSTIVQEYISNKVNGCIVSGTYTFDFTKENEPQQVKARYSFVFNSQGLILNHHSSEMPV